MSNENKTQGQLLEEQLLMAPKNGGESLAAEEIAKADAFCEGYKAFLKHAKTEREAVAQAIEILKAHGYVEFVRTKNTDQEIKFMPAIAAKRCVLPPLAPGP